MLAGAGDADVEQPALLGELLGRGGVLDGQRGVGEPDEEDGVPLEALGRVQRRERDALDGRRVLGVGALVELGDELGRGARPASAASRSSASVTSAASDSHRSRAAPPGGGLSGYQPRLPSTPRTASGSDSSASLGRARGTAQQQPGLADLGAGRRTARRRAARTGTPASVSACS